MYKLFFVLLIGFTPTLSQATDVIDALFLYSDSALKSCKYSKKKTCMVLKIKSDVNELNRAFKRSKLNIRVNISGIKKVTVDDKISLGSKKTKSLLRKYKSSRTIKKLKSKYKSDIVVAYRGRTKNAKAAGVSAFILGNRILNVNKKVLSGNESNYRSSKKYYNFYKNSAFLFVGVGKNISRLILAHEVGHILGLAHPQREGFYKYSRGYGEKKRFVTIMGYPKSFSTKNRIARFSNPRSRKCNYRSCGIDKYKSNGADAYSTLRETASIVSGFVTKKAISRSKKKRIKDKIIRNLRSFVRKYKKYKKRRNKYSRKSEKYAYYSSKMKIVKQKILNTYYYKYKAL